MSSDGPRAAALPPHLADPLDRVIALGARATRTGGAVGLAFALALHGTIAGRALASPYELRDWTEQMRAAVHDRLWAVYDVEVPKPAEPPPAPEPDKAPEPAPAPTPAPRAAKAAPVEPAAAAAQAGKILAQAPDPDEPVDLTKDGFVTGNADSYAGGVTAASGTSKDAVYDRNARADGTPGGKGTGPAPTGPDRSRGATIAPGASWSSCPFPAEADADQIDFQTVQIIVTVRGDGTAQSVKVLADPGHGFGRAARQCALGQRFVAALDRDGSPMLGTTPPILVRFTR